MARTRGVNHRAYQRVERAYRSNRDARPGDTVAYALPYLDSIGMTHSFMSHMRGTVKSVSELRIAEVEWKRASPCDSLVEELSKVFVGNLARPEERGRFYRD